MNELWASLQREAKNDPGRTAVEGAADLSYEELCQRVADAAAELRRFCGPGEVVALACSSPVTSLVQLLAVQAMDGIFLPLDVNGPQARREHALEVAGARLLVSDAEDGGPRLQALRGGGAGVARPDRGGYLIFTSGSTGAPKGVHVSADALAERLAGLLVRPGFDREDSFLALTSLSFDISLAEYLLPILCGGRVVLAPTRARRDIEVFESVVNEFRPRVVQATPSFWRLMLASGWRGAPWASIWCGGEHMTSQLAKSLMAGGRQLWNVYGPTEATIWATADLVEDGDDIALGEPLAGTGLALLDENGRLTDRPGSEGEIVLWGAGLAEGYVNQPGAREFFEGGEPPKPCYRTGDRARRTGEGRLRYLGRADSQIKLHGNRIELAEIEAVLEKTAGVVDAVVFPCDLDSPSGGHLVACVTSRDAALNARELRKRLLDVLPAVMVPRKIVVQDELPRSSSGKLDRARIKREWFASRPLTPGTVL